MSVLSLAARIEAKPGKGAESRRVLTALVQPTRAEEGCLTDDLHVANDDPGFLFREEWRTVASWERHMSTPVWRCSKAAPTNRWRSGSSTKRPRSPERAPRGRPAPGASVVQEWRMPSRAPWAFLAALPPRRSATRPHAGTRGRGRVGERSQARREAIPERASLVRGAVGGTTLGDVRRVEADRPAPSRKPGNFRPARSFVPVRQNPERVMRNSLPRRVGVPAPMLPRPMPSGAPG